MNKILAAEYREYIEKYLADWYARFHDLPQKQLFEAMEYSLLAGGKRLRPVFAFAQSYTAHFLDLLLY